MPESKAALNAPQPRAKAPQRGRMEWILISLVVLYAALLLVGPLAAIIWGSFSKGISEFFLQIASPDAVSALKLTMILTIGATIINTVFGVSLAWILVRDDFHGRRFIDALVDLPFAVSPVIAGLMLILLFGRGGWFAGIIDAAGIKMVFAPPGMLLATIFVTLPFVTREVMPVLVQIGTVQESAAYTIGASSWQAFWHVTLPSIRWGLFYGISLTFARALGEFGALLVVSGGVSGMTETSTLFIFRSLDDRNYVGAYAMAMTLAAISFSILMLMEFFKKRTEVR
ncbi:MAG TPA: sulfate ABC transporter permease subunit [Acidobacteriota bacterium]